VSIFLAILENQWFCNHYYCNIESYFIELIYEDEAGCVIYKPASALKRQRNSSETKLVIERNEHA
jgi:hypothetical protein